MMTVDVKVRWLMTHWQSRSVATAYCTIFCGFLRGFGGIGLRLQIYKSRKSETQSFWIKEFRNSQHLIESKSNFLKVHEEEEECNNFNFADLLLIFLLVDDLHDIEIFICIPLIIAFPYLNVASLEELLQIIAIFRIRVVL